MRKLCILLSILLGFSAQAQLPQESLIISNFTAISMNGSIRLHTRQQTPFPYLGDVPMAIPANGNMFIYNGLPGIPFSGMSPFTTSLGLHGGGYSSTQTVATLQFCCNEDYKWWCIKSDVVPYYTALSSGYIGICPSYDSSMGSYTSPAWDMAVLNTPPYEVYRLGDPYNDYNVTYPSTITGVNNVVVTNSASPFGGYMVTVSLN